MKIVMIHCWPSLQEAGWLAEFHSNVYINTRWRPVLDPLSSAKGEPFWWNYLPSSQITRGHDSTTGEMACASALFTRELRGATHQFGCALSYWRAWAESEAEEQTGLGPVALIS